MTAYIGYNNEVKSGVITTTSDAAGYAKENAQSWKQSSWWQSGASGTVYFYVDAGAAVDVDSWGFAGSDLFDNSGTIKPQYSATGTWAGEQVDLDSLHTPSKNITVFKKVTSVNARYFRFEIDSIGAASFFANLFLGQSLQLQRGMPLGFSPANLNRDRKIYNNKSNGGAFLGRSIKYKGAKVDIKQKGVTRAWIDANWDALADHIELYPFYFSWNQVSRPDEAAYCVANNIIYPKYQLSLFEDFEIRCVATYDL